MLKAFILVLVAIGMGLLVYWLASRQESAPARKPLTVDLSPTSRPETVRGTSLEPNEGHLADAAPPTGPIAPPRTAQQKESDATEARRAEFYENVHRDARDAFVMIKPAEEDAATLDIKAAQDSPGDVLTLLNIVFRNNAYYYGFRHVRFYAPNASQAVEHYRLAAEASADSQGNWQTFQK